MIKRKDLVDIADADYDARQGEFMQCLDCGEEFGGTRGDFFMINIEATMDCPKCESENIAIVRRVSKIVIVKQ